MGRRERGSTAARRAVLYLRQSTPRDESVSMEQQETACRDYCVRHGLVVVAVEQDGITGRTWRRRPGVQRAMTALDERTADVLVLWKWSRLARRRLDFEVALDRVRGVGGEVASATEPIDQTTAAGRFQRGVLAEVAAFEAERIGEGWEETHERRRAAGLPAQGGRRYGYTRGPAGSYLVQEDEAEVLRWAYARVLEGRGASWIAVELNRRGVPNPIGRTWTQRRVYPLLDSGFAAGLLIHRPRGEHNRARATTYHDGVHPPIISRETWAAYQLMRRAAVKTAPRTVEPRYPLTGLITCGDCGASMWPTRAKGHGAGHSYVCSWWRRTKTVRCVTIVRARAETAVLEWLRRYADDIEAAAAADSSAQDRALRSRRAARDAGRQAVAIEEKIARLNRAWIEGTVPDAGYTATRDEYLAELATAREEAEQAEIDAGRRTVPAATTATSLIDEWDELPAADRRNLLASLIERVEVHPPERRGQWSRVVVVSR